MNMQSIVQATFVALTLATGSVGVSAEDSRHALNPAPKGRQCYHSGDGYCRAQMLQKERAAFTAKLKVQNRKAQQCGPAPLADSGQKREPAGTTTVAASP